MKNNYILIFLLSISCFSFSQEIIGAAGNTFKGEKIQLDYTVGEIAITSVNNETIELEQGFHRGLIIEQVTSESELQNSVLEVKIWPNPTSNIFNIKTKSSTISYSLMNMNMQTLNIEGNITPNTSKSVNISELEMATYFLQLRDEHNNTKVFKIIKSN